MAEAQYGDGQDDPREATSVWVRRVRQDTARLLSYVNGVSLDEDEGGLGRVAAGSRRETLGAVYLNAVRLSRVTLSFMPEHAATRSLAPVSVLSVTRCRAENLRQLVRWSAEDLEGVFDLLEQADPDSLIGRDGFRVEGWQFPCTRSRMLGVAFAKLGLDTEQLDLADKVLS